MKQILLAIDGDVPSRPVFQYAADLCRQIRAELCILQFASEERKRHSLLSTASGSLEKMLASPECPVPVKVSSSAGNLEKGLSDYVETHHDVVLTVYDPGQNQPKATRARSKRFKGLEEKLSVPLVVFNRKAPGPS